MNFEAFFMILNDFCPTTASHEYHLSGEISDRNGLYTDNRLCKHHVFVHHVLGLQNKGEENVFFWGFFPTEAE